MGITRLIKNNPRPIDDTSMMTLVQAASGGGKTRLLDHLADKADRA